MISIIIPAYNEEKRIARTLRRIEDFFEEKQEDYEILVVNDGSTDRTVEAVKELSRDHVRVIDYLSNKGKGYAVRKGMLEAKGDFLLFSDADLSTPIQELDKFLPFAGDFEVVIGSRAMKESEIVVHQPLYRELMGKTFNKAVRLLTVRGIRDTQCGFKLFTKEAVHKVFPRQKLNGFSFDVEILYLAKKLGFRIREVPVTWINDEDTKVNSIKDSMKMFFDLLKIRWLHAGKKKI